jgi:hypothetical protein
MVATWCEARTDPAVEKCRCSTARWIQYVCPRRRGQVPRASADHEAKTATAVRLMRQMGLVLASAFVVVLWDSLAAADAVVYLMNRVRGAGQGRAG